MTLFRAVGSARVNDTGTAGVVTARARRRVMMWRAGVACTASVVMAMVVTTRAGYAQGPTSMGAGTTATDAAVQDPIVESALIGAAREFGASVAVDDDTLIVGAPTASAGGAVYVFTRSEDAWVETAKLVVPAGVPGDRFGDTVALAGDTLVVPVPTATVHGNSEQGAAYVFTRAEEIWTFSTTLVASDGAAGDGFGEAVALAHDRVVVGAPQAAGGFSGPGAAYVFTRAEGTWSETARLTGSDASVGDRVGWSVALAEATLVVGTARNFAEGWAYVFREEGDTWTETAKLVASDAREADWFASSLATDGDTIVVGAFGAKVSDDPGAGEGAAYVFSRTDDTWTEVAKLFASDGAPLDGFGTDLALAGDTLVVNAPSSGLYVFVGAGEAWAETAKLTPSDTDPIPILGSALRRPALLGDKVLAGSTFREAVYEFATDAGGGTETAVVSLPFRQHFAEGATGFFQTDVGLFNPSETDVAEVLVTLSPEAPDGAVTVPLTLEPRTRQTIDVNAAMGDDATGVSIRLESDQPVVATRQVRWDSTLTFGSTLESSIPHAAATWYFAEGATSVTNLFYLIANPNNVEANVAIRYLRGDGEPVTQDVVVPAQSRRTLWANRVPGLESSEVAAVISADRPIVAERSMYFGPQFNAGATSRGASALSERWLFAEGATGFFDTFLAFGNPGDTPTEVTVTYHLPDGTALTKTHEVPAASRRTILVNGEDPQLASTAVAMSVSSSDPIVAERAMWWGPTAASWYEAHATLGATEEGWLWAIGEGAVGGPREEDTYVLVANPRRRSGALRLTVVLDDGTRAEETVAVRAGELRRTLRVRDYFPQVEGQRFSMLVDSRSVPDGLATITVEYARYQSTGGRFGNAGGVALASRIE